MASSYASFLSAEMCFLVSRVRLRGLRLEQISLPRPDSGLGLSHCYTSHLSAEMCFCVSRLRFKVPGSKFRVSEFRVPDFDFCVPGSGFRVSGFQVSEDKVSGLG